MTGGKGIKAFLGSYREIVEELIGGEGIIVYSGCAGTCTPFAELLAYTVRDLDVKQYYSIDLEPKFHPMAIMDHGVVVEEDAIGLKEADLVVLLGGLAMPHSEVTAEDANRFIENLGNPNVVGVCFMSIFDEAGWTDEVDFDAIIDAYIEVEVKR